MWSFISIAIGFLALAVLAFTDLHQPVMGFSPTEIAALLCFGALLAVLAGRIQTRIQQRLPWRASAAWTLLFALTPVVFYVRSDELSARIDNYIIETLPGRTVTSGNGEVIALKNGGGFMLTGMVNGYQTRFTFDTGATTVVLMSETASALGINVDDLKFTQPVYTANGRTLAARYELDTITIGGITERHIRALIAQKGALTENLLGMTFLDRLDSYEVRGNRLILRAKMSAQPSSRL